MKAFVTKLSTGGEPTQTIDLGESHPTWTEFITKLGYNKAWGIWIRIESLGGMQPQEHDQVIPNIEFVGIFQGGPSNGHESFSVVFVK